MFGASFSCITYAFSSEIYSTDSITAHCDSILGVNTPERDEPCYSEATNANRALVEDQIVVLIPDVTDTDQYGRLLRYVYVGDEFVNAALVRDGWAEARRYEPDTTQYELLDNFEAVAYAAGIGCWSSGVFER